ISTQAGSTALTASITAGEQRLAPCTVSVPDALITRRSLWSLKKSCIADLPSVRGARGFAGAQRLRRDPGCRPFVLVEITEQGRERSAIGDARKRHCIVENPGRAVTVAAVLQRQEARTNGLGRREVVRMQRAQQRQRLVR